MKLKHAALESALAALLAVFAIGPQAVAAQYGSQAQGSTAATQSIANKKAANPGVMAVQKQLKSKGYDVGPVDGLWGSRSIGALKKFQKAKGLKQTGAVNQQTAEALGISSRERLAFNTELNKHTGKKQSPGVRSNGPKAGASGSGGSMTHGSKSGTTG